MRKKSKFSKVLLPSIGMVLFFHKKSIWQKPYALKRLRFFCWIDMDHNMFYILEMGFDGIMYPLRNFMCFP